MKAKMLRTEMTDNEESLRDELTEKTTMLNRSVTLLWFTPSEVDRSSGG